MTYLLDTHAWYWLATGSAEMPQELVDELQGHSGLLGVAAVSPAELAMKDRIGKAQPERAAGLKFAEPFRSWVTRALPEDTYRVVPLTPAICAEAFDLPGDFHKDPWDMMIVATARVENLVLVTADEDIAAYPHVRKRCFTPVRVNRGRHRGPQ